MIALGPTSGELIPVAVVGPAGGGGFHAFDRGVGANPLDEGVLVRRFGVGVGEVLEVDFGHPHGGGVGLGPHAAEEFLARAGAVTVNGEEGGLASGVGSVVLHGLTLSFQGELFTGLRKVFFAFWSSQLNW